MNSKATTLLAIETSTQACSVALLYDGQILQEYQLAPRDHTRLVLPMVHRLLEKTGITLSQVDGLAFTQGPGSFTGLRIGFGVVQGLAYGADIPVVPVSTLEVMAVRARDQFDLDQAIILSALDARMGEVYWALYEAALGGIKPIFIPSVTSPQSVSDELISLVGPTQNLIAVGNGWPLVARCGISASLADEDLMPDARSTLRLAEPLFAQGLGKPIENIGLLYVRDEVTWKKRQKIRS